MFTTEQFAAIGRLALSFNEIEYLFDVYVAHILNTPEWSVGESIAEQGFFHQKADRFKRILAAIRKERPACNAVVNAVLGLISEAKQLAEDRNGYVHALIVEDMKNQVTLLQIRGREQPVNQADIEALAEKTISFRERLNLGCAQLLVALEDARAKK
jgi:hypothetical protein